MSLLGGGLQAGPWFQNTVALGAFGVLAPRYDWIPAWFFISAPTCPPSISEQDFDDDDASIMAQALDSLIEESDDDEDFATPQVVQPQCACRRLSIIEASSSEDSSLDEEEEDAASPIRRAAQQRVRLCGAITNKESKGRFPPRSVQNT